MKKKILLSLMAGSLLIMQSCSKKDTDLPTKTPDSTKHSETIPSGCMSGVLPTGTYKFMPYLSTIDPAINKTMGVAGGSTAAGALVEQRDYTNTVQQWRVTQTGFGTYSIINYNSGLSVDDKNYSQADNNPIWQQPFHGNSSQQWVIEYQGLGVYRIKSVVNLNMGLHVAGGSVANGANLVLKSFATTNPGWGYFFIYNMPISNPPVTVYSPPANNTDKYPRVVQLPDNSLLASFENRVHGVQTISSAKFHRSTNNGASWTLSSTLTDTRPNASGLFEPDLFVTPVALGTLPAHSLLCVGRGQIDFVPDFPSKKSSIDLYISTNNGSTWTKRSTLAIGGGGFLDGGTVRTLNIFEPSLIIDNLGRLLCYYTDARTGGGHSDKIVYQASTDGGLTWGAAVTAIQYPGTDVHTGMAKVAKMGNGKYIMTYESFTPSPAVHFKISNDGYNWINANVPGTNVTSIDGVTAQGTPTVTWTPAGSVNGTLIVTSISQNPTSSRGTDNFVNFNNGTGNWYRVPQPLPYTDHIPVVESGYSRSTSVSADGKTLYHINCVNKPDNSVNEIKFVATPAW